MRRCFTGPHYWKNPALRRSREKKTFPGKERIEESISGRTAVWKEKEKEKRRK